MIKLSDQMYMGQGLRRYTSYNPWNYIRSARTLRVTPQVMNSGVELTDVSFYQKVIDFNRMKLAGMQGTIIRAGQNVWKDPYFDANWGNAKKAGLPRGSYFFYDSRVPPKGQGDLYWSMIKNDPGELFAAADFEESYAGPYAGWRNLYDFMERLLSNGLPQKMLWIYTGYYYWLDHSPQTDLSALAWFSQFPLWLAWYTTNPAYVKIPRPWPDAQLWQYGTPARGAEVGVKTAEIDMNLWTGDQKSYWNYFNLGGEVIPPEVTTMKFEVRSNVAIETRAIRRGPGIIFGSVTNLPADSIAMGDFKYTYTQSLNTDGLVRANIGDEWVHVTMPVDGWMARVHLGKVYTVLTSVPDPAPVDEVTSVTTSQEWVIKHRDGRVENFRGTDLPLSKV